MNRFNRYIAFILLSAWPTVEVLAQERYDWIDQELNLAIGQPGHGASQICMELAESRQLTQADGQRPWENPEFGNPFTFQKEKVIEKAYPIQANHRLQIDNRYGKITIRNWARNEMKVTIRIRTAENSERRSQEALDRVRIDESKTSGDISFQTTISSGNSNWWSSLTSDGGDRSLSIDYEVYLPKRNALSLSNRYGAIELDDRDGKVELSLSYGSLRAGQLNGRQNSLSIAYSKADMAYLNEGDISIRYGGLTLSEAEKLHLSLSYASGTEIGKVNREADVSVRYSGGFRMGLGPTIERADVSASYSSVSITPDEKAAFSFDIAVSYGGFDYNRRLANIGSKSEGNTSKSYTGYWNRDVVNNSVNISSKYGAVSLK